MLMGTLDNEVHSLNLFDEHNRIFAKRHLENKSVE